MKWLHLIPIKKKVDLLNDKLSPIEDKEIENYLSTKILNFRATTNKYEAYKNANYVIIATPTNYDPVQITLIHQALKLSFVT